jgi:hypothetical protein
MLATRNLHAEDRTVLSTVVAKLWSATSNRSGRIFETNLP